MDQDEYKLLVKIAQMYYEENKTQSEISRSLGIHRTSISRMLKTIREKNIVKISVNYDFVETVSLENEIKKKFNLKEVIIVPMEPSQVSKIKQRAIGSATANYLSTIVKDNYKIGFSWGSTLSEVVSELKPQNYMGVVCVPMIGGPSGRIASQYHVNTITYEAAKKLNGESILIDSPAILESQKIRDALMKTEFNEQIKNIWGKLDIAIVGIGSPLVSENEIWKGFYEDKVIGILKENNVAGDIVSRFYDIYGNIIETDVSNKIIGISLDKLKLVPYRIGVAESKNKVSGILGALNGGYINILVTTEETAIKLIDEYSK